MATGGAWKGLARRMASALRARLARLKVAPRQTSAQLAKAARDWVDSGAVAPKAHDLRGRFREIISDPINLLIQRHPLAGCTQNGFVVLHNGNVVPFDGPFAYYEGFSDILVINRGVHEPVEEYAFQEVIRQLSSEPLMIELGAYWAHYSMWLMKERSGARVYLVEPDHHNLEVGQHNVRINGYQAEFIHAAVGTGQFEVDTFLTQRKIAKVDILHMDVQGHEVEALRGAEISLSAKMIDYVFVSTHSEDLHAQVRASLARHGYRIELSEGVDTQTTSADGFVLASSPLVAPAVNGFSPLGRLEIAQAKPSQLVRSISQTSALLP